MGKPAVRVHNVTKSFRIPTESSSGLKQKLINLLRGKRGYRLFTPLKGISFEIEPGEFFGIVGRNGSGKSTLLKTIAGIYRPTQGSVEVNGSLVPFIELGVGFNPELTGRENVFLNGALLGFSRGQVEAMYNEIVAFAELEEFMDEKLKNYSSGMQVRLAFSVAIQAKGDVLLLDEVLAVGDEAFQRKCYDYFAQLKREKRTVILVTHDMGSVQRFCTKAMLIEDGQITVMGSTRKVTDRYQEINLPSEVTTTSDQPDQPPAPVRSRGTITTELNKTVFRGGHDRQIVITNTVVTDRDISDAFFGFTIRKEDGTPVFWYTTEPPHQPIKQFRAGQPVVIEFAIQNIFGDGSYFIDVSVKSNDRSEEHIIHNQIREFTVAGWGQNGWMLHPDAQVTIR